jgi:hypothetical protein
MCFENEGRETLISVTLLLYGRTKFVLIIWQENKYAEYFGGRSFLHQTFQELTQNV